MFLRPHPGCKWQLLAPESSATIFCWIQGHDYSQTPHSCPLTPWQRIHLPVQELQVQVLPDLGGSHLLQSNWDGAPQILSLCSTGRLQQLPNPWAAATEAGKPRSPSAPGEATQWVEPVLCTKRSHTTRSLCATTLEQPHLTAAAETPRKQQKIPGNQPHWSRGPQPCLTQTMSHTM